MALLHLTICYCFAYHFIHHLHSLTTKRNITGPTSYMANRSQLTSSPPLPPRILQTLFLDAPVHSSATSMHIIMHDQQHRLHPSADETSPQPKPAHRPARCCRLRPTKQFILIQSIHRLVTCRIRAADLTNIVSQLLFDPRSPRTSSAVMSPINPVCSITTHHKRHSLILSLSRCETTPEISTTYAPAEPSLQLVLCLSNLHSFQPYSRRSLVIDAGPSFSYRVGSFACQVRSILIRCIAPGSACSFFIKASINCNWQ